MCSVVPVSPPRVAAQQEGVRTLQAVEVVKILGATEDISSSIAKLTVGRDGRMAFYDGPGARFVFFDSTGKRIGAFGRAGEGPGEFSGGPIAFFYTGFVGDVSLPRAGLMVHEASRSAIWAVERDADGFSNIIRLRLEPAR